MKRCVLRQGSDATTLREIGREAGSQSECRLGAEMGAYAGTDPELGRC